MKKHITVVAQLTGEIAIFVIDGQVRAKDIIRAVGMTSIESSVVVVPGLSTCGSHVINRYLNAEDRVYEFVVDGGTLLVLSTSLSMKMFEQSLTELLRKASTNNKEACHASMPDVSR